MGWIKTANTLGKYQRSYRGFRIYFTPKRVLAMDKTKTTLQSITLEGIGIEIDLNLFIRLKTKAQ